MYTENIIRDIRDLIHDVEKSAARAYSNRLDAVHVFGYVKEGSEGTAEAYETVSQGLVDASEAFNQVKDDMLNIAEMLNTLIYNIEMEALSAKVQAK